MTKIAVVTAVYGGYDPVRPLPAQDGADVDGWLFTDDEALAQAPPPGWRGCWMPRPRMEPRLAAKCPKAVPHRYIPSSYDVIIWMDGHLEATSSRFAVSLAEDLGEHDWGMFPHTHTRGLTQELALSHVTGKYPAFDIDAQVERYLELGHPDTWGMWMSGLIVRRPTPLAKQVGDLWMAEILTWSVQDQLSFPFAARRCGLQPKDLPFEGWWTGDRFMLHRHVDGSG